MTALMLACEFRHLEIVRYLIEHGSANASAARTTDGMTALVWASQEGHLEIVRCLVERGGANVNASCTDDGSTALMLASENGHLEIVQLLLQHGADRSARRGKTAHALAFAHPLVQAALLA